MQCSIHACMAVQEMYTTRFQKSVWRR